MRRIRRAAFAAGIALVTCASPAAAQYTAPPPDPGFQYIFDGSATGTTASFDKWTYAGSSTSNSATAGRATLDAAEGAIRVGASPFGSYWYTPRAFGNTVFRIQYQIENTPTATPNGGIMVRSPEFRFPAEFSSTQVLAAKPTGYNYDVCNLAITLCNLTTPGATTSYNWAGAPGPFPPAGEYTGTYCSRQGPHQVAGPNGQTPLQVNGNAINSQHWTQVYCGHEIQINESLTGGGPRPSGDAIKTGSVYGFRNLNAQQARTYERLDAGVWHEYEIRTIGQQYTIMIDGNIINQFDNSIPKINTRNGDPPTMARQFAQGYLGLQTHGGSDRISYREIQVKDVPAADVPVNTVAPSVTGSGFQGNPLTCNHGTWNTATGSEYFVKWYRSNKVLPTAARYRAPSATDLGNITTPADPRYGTQALTWTDSLLVGEADTYTPTAEDVGKVIHCAVNVNNGGATVWKTAQAPEILSATNVNQDAGGTVPATLSLTLGTPASFGAFTPGVTRTYTAATTANVISTAGNAALTVSDPSTTSTGHLVNGAFSLPQPLKAVGSNLPATVTTYNGPVSNDAAAVEFSQQINANDALRTGAYSKTLTFTLSTTAP